MFNQIWTASYHQIAAIDDSSQNITLRNAYKTSVGDAGHRFYLVNWREELDEPGEFYYDR